MSDTTTPVYDSVTLTADPTSAMEVTTKQYVDALAGLWSAGHVTNIGANLALNSGTLSATGTLGVSSITIGTGLTGGTITSTGTVAVSFGTVAGSVAAGNDSRFATIPGASTITPMMDGIAAVGSSMTFARGDHVHPTDSTRAAANNPSFTGTVGSFTVASPGIQYYASPNHFSFGWNGNINCYIDTNYIGDVATTGWVTGAFVQTGYLTANYWTASTTQNWVNSNFKPASAYTPNQNVDYNSSPTFGDCHTLHISTGATSGSLWSFWSSYPSAYIRQDSSSDWGPIPYASEARFKQDFAPSAVDFLGVIKRFAVQQFRYRKPADAPLVPAGFTTDQVKTVHPSAVHTKPEDAPPGADFRESINTTVMCALLVGAIKQLSVELDRLKARLA